MGEDEALVLELLAEHWPVLHQVGQAATALDLDDDARPVRLVAQVTELEALHDLQLPRFGSDAVQPPMPEMGSAGTRSPIASRSEAIA